MARYHRPMLGRLIIFAVGALIGFVWWQIRKVQARKRLAELDEGRRCLSCNSHDVVRGETSSKCNECGFVTEFARLAKTKVSDQDVSDWTR